MPRTIRSAIKSIAYKIPVISHIMAMHGDIQHLATIVPDIRNLTDLLREDYLARLLDQDERFKAPLNLNRFERQVFSQNGEDGIIEEIFKRIGVTNKYFVEFGVGNGLENNTLYLLMKEWSGAWIEGSGSNCSEIAARFRSTLINERVLVKNAHITSENIGSLLKELDVPVEFDLLSIDIDRNDYWVWKAIKDHRPRVVVIEYNALFPPGVKWIIPYNPDAVWDRTTYFNASLESLGALALRKGYNLVVCNLTGVNAFFVRNDLGYGKFQEPFTTEQHYQPARYHLIAKFGRQRGTGDYLVR